MQIRKIISKILICIVCVLFIHGPSFCATNIPYGNIGEYGDWLNIDNMEMFNGEIASDLESFENRFQDEIRSPGFVPIEAKIGLVFMKALSSIDYVLQISLVRFTIMFLFAMYAFWIAIESYKMMRESTDYKEVLYDIFKKGFTIAIWVIILEYGVTDTFNMLIGPILSLGTYLSNFILDAVAQTYNINIPDTCSAIHNYVNNNTTPDGILIDSNTAANIMCLPGRLSVYFYHAVGAAWDWIKYGFGHSATAVFLGGVAIVIFIKCIFQYAFMTLGVVADLFLTLLMLPFTAIAESMPEVKEKNYVGQILTGFLKAFNTKKLSDVIAVFINAAVYFVSLSIVIAICAALLTNLISVNGNNMYDTGSVMTVILCGCLVLYLASKADEYAKKLGGKIDNSFGSAMQKNVETFWKDTKNFTGKAYQNWVKKK